MSFESEVHCLKKLLQDHHGCRRALRSHGGSAPTSSDQQATAHGTMRAVAMVECRAPIKRARIEDDDEVDVIQLGMSSEYKVLAAKEEVTIAFREEGVQRAFRL